MTYNDAKAELYSILNTALIANISLLGGESLDMRFPGISKPASLQPVDGFWARVQFVTITDQQSSLACQGGIKRYEALGQLLFILYSPISLAASLENGNMFAEAIRNAFCSPSPSGLLMLTNQLMRETGNNDTHYLTQVSVNATYYDFR